MQLMRARGLGARILGLSAADSRRQPTRAASETSPDQIEWHDDREHALQLVRWCYGGLQPLAYQGEVSAREVMAAYRDMVADMGWLERPWNQVGKFLRVTLQGGAKTYSGRSRQRVYRFPPRCPV